MGNVCHCVSPLPPSLPPPLLPCTLSLVLQPMSLSRDSCIPLFSLRLGAVAEAVRHIGSLWSLCCLPFLFHPANSKAWGGLGPSLWTWVEAPFQTVILGLVLAVCASPGPPRSIPVPANPGGSLAGCVLLSEAEEDVADEGT